MLSDPSAKALPAFDVRNDTRNHHFFHSAMGGMTVSRLCLPLAFLLAGAVSPVRADDDTPAAAKTRKLLKEKITVDFKEQRLED